ncbi:pilus assembly protein PilM [Candidatus Roizmanbacteria bacterium]|nr:pilus assembly protein PilM [Candidatus Roizmanbacteria bacterium]
MASNFFCLDLGESYIKVADIIKKGDLFEAVNLGMIETDQTFFRGESEKIIEKQAAIITKLLAQLKLVKKNVNIIIPDSYSYNQFVQMPHLNEKELLSAIRYQADQFIPMPLEEINLDIEIIREDEKNNKLLTLIAASPKKITEKVEKLIEYAGLAPQSIETEISAVGRTVSEIFKKIQAPSQTTSGILLININLTTSSLYFFDHREGLLTFSFNFNVGYNLFLKEIQVNLNVDQKKAEELLKNFGFAKNTSYELQTILTPVIKDFLSEIQKALTLLKEKGASQIGKMYVFNEALRFHAVEEIIKRYFAIPTAPFDLYPFFVKNNVVESFKNQLGFFVSSVGGNLR